MAWNIEQPEPAVQLLMTVQRSVGLTSHKEKIFVLALMSALDLLNQSEIS
jgi:hypothetical protein